MAGDYIRREDARRMVVQLDKYAWKSPVSNERRVTVDVDLVKFGLDRIPAADVAEVVRCKNCKWFADNNGGEWYGCQMFQVVRITPEDAPKPDDFCSHGERREGGNDNVSD